jgi:hypothetical protein
MLLYTIFFLPKQGFLNISSGNPASGVKSYRKPLWQASLLAVMVAVTMAYTKCFGCD